MLKLKKRVFRLPGWSRRFTSWLSHRVHNLTRTQRIVCASVAGVLLLSVTVPTALVIIKNQSYKLSAEVQQLIGTPNKNLSAKITYNSEKDSWQFNQSNIPIGSSAQQADMPSVADLKAQIGGTGKKDESLYAVDMPSSGSKGVTYYDTNTDLSFSLVPQFKLGDGRRSSEGHIVYPSQNGTKLIYTAKANGMKEDIVLTKPIGDELEFSYKLNLPDTLTAKVQDDGSLGVFSPDPILFGNISTGNGQDKEKILSARKTAAKDHLLFVLPAPVIVEAGGTHASAKAKFSLDDGILTVKASGLADLHYPLSIDPSVVVTSSSDFAAGNGDNISYDTDQISRAKLTGATLNSWATTTAYANAGTSGVGSAAYNGYIYAVGGNNGGSQEAEVEYAPINSDGTIGSWTATTDMSIPRTYHGFTVYNGYAYALGGSTTGWSIQSSTEYAPINSNGTIGSWTSTTAFPTERTSANAVAYNGYMYLIGGLTNSGVVNSVLYAPIKADGSLGSWNTTSSFTTARCNSVSFASNGRMYVIGGYDNSSAYYSDTQYATINADGTLGSWTATTSYTTARAGAFGGTYGGYAYLSGGTSNANSGGDAHGDTQYAQINADGTLGSWRTMSATLASDRFAGTMSFYKGYAYAVGGVENGSGARITQYAAINPAGVTSSYTATTSLSAALDGHESVVANGRLYVLGGSTNGTRTNAVQFAPINSDGTVGSWTSTTSFTTARNQFAVATWNGYLYVLGGNTGTRQNDVQYAPINSDGTVGSWTATTSFTTARTSHRAIAYNGYLYVMGGNIAGGTTNNVQYAPINSDGTVGSWTATTSFTTERYGFGAAVYGNNLYIYGGSGATNYNDVQYAPINSDGTVGSWTATTSFTTARRYFGSVIINGYLYILGGTTGTRQSDVQYAPINSDGSLGTWATTTNLTSARNGQTVESYNGNIIIIGGNNGSSMATVEYAAVNNGGGGGISTWQQKTSGIGSTLYGYGSAYNNGFFYVIGGDTTGSNSATANTYYAPLNSNGTIGTWTATSSLGTARHSQATYVSGGYVYVVGGSNSGGSIISSVEYAPINSNGTLGSWSTATGSLSSTTKQMAHVAYNGYLYALGGTTGSLSSTVYYANAASGGDVASWSTTTSLPYTVRNGSAVVNNGYLYVVGGIDGSGPTGKVVYAPINSNGTLGSWSYASSMPTGGATAAVTANGVLYTLGIDGASCTSTTYMATIGANGSLGPFQQTSNVTAGACTASNGKGVYIDGLLYFPLENGSVSGANVNTIARIGHYTKLLNLSGGYALTSIAYGGALPNGGLSNITYKSANSGGVFGSSQAATGLTGSFTGCTGNVDTMYVQLRAKLDDTYTSVYPDANGTAANITDMTVNYQSPRAETNQRLMHGKFFSNESLQGLDTCGS